MRRATFILAFLLLTAPCEGGIITVDDDAPGPAQNGSSWTHAYKYLQDALAVAQYGDEVRVAEGIYTPDSNSAEPNGTDDRDATFQLINGVAVCGGYAGFGEPDPNARDVELYETTLSGDLDGNDVDVNDLLDLLYEPSRAENSYHVVTSSGTDETAVLDGLTITAGNANDPCLNDPRSDGGGMYNDSGSPTLNNCTFSENSARWDGGGAYNCIGNSTFTNCTFSRNSAGTSGTGHGGGMYCTGSPTTLNNCIFAGNWAGQGGGAEIGGGGPTIVNCTFSNNSGNFGGGMQTNNDSTTLTGCTFSGNSAYKGGAGRYLYSSSTFSKCLFIGNRADNYGGGIVSGNYSTLTFINCTLAGNSAPEGNALACDSYQQSRPSNVEVTNCIIWDGGDEVVDKDGSTITITYSNVQGGWTGAGNIGNDPCFADPCNGDYHLQSAAGRWDPNSESWVIDANTSLCIDAGNPGCPVGSEPMPNGNRINMGDYGGTPTASKSPADWRSIADLTNDWVVDFNDLAVFVDYWLDAGECVPSDLNRSEFANFADYAIFADNWRVE